MNGSKRCNELGVCPFDVTRIFRFQSQFDRIHGIIEVRVRAEQQIGKILQQPVQSTGDLAFIGIEEDFAKMEGGIAEGLPYTLEFPLQDLRYARENIDV